MSAALRNWLETQARHQTRKFQVGQTIIISLSGYNLCVRGNLGQLCTYTPTTFEWTKPGHLRRLVTEAAQCDVLSLPLFSALLSGLAVLEWARKTLDKKRKKTSTLYSVLILPNASGVTF
jgi:hypothetical protein